MTAISRRVRIAATICAANAVWSVWWLIVAALSGWGCGGRQPAPGEHCGDAGGILLAWYLSEWILILPTLVAGTVLLRNWPGASRDALGRAGLAGLSIFVTSALMALYAMFVAH